MSARRPRRPRTPRGTDRVLDARELNRALLQRQMLVRRRRIDVLDAVERLVGLQAQVPSNPYVALWSRLERFRSDALSDAIENRRAVRMGLMRSTLHLVTAHDAVDLRPLFGPVMHRVLHTQSPYGRQLDGIDIDELAKAAAMLLEDRPRTRAELGPLLAERWPDRDPAALSWAASYLLPLVQVPPRGLWRRSGRSAFTTLEAWLGAPSGGGTSVDDVVLRYLAAFGPSTVADVQAWSGWQGMRAALDAMRPRLRILRDERGRELFDVPDAPLPDRGMPAPVRFLPEYDNVFLAHADRARIVDEEHRSRMFVVGWGQVLVDGFLAARWRIEEDEADVVLVVRPYRPLSPSERSDVETEGEPLVAFVAEDTDRREVRFLSV